MGEPRGHSGTASRFPPTTGLPQPKLTPSLLVPQFHHQRLTLLPSLPWVFRKRARGCLPPSCSCFVYCSFRPFPRGLEACCAGVMEEVKIIAYEKFYLKQALKVNLIISDLLKLRMGGIQSWKEAYDPFLRYHSSLAASTAGREDFLGKCHTA